MPYHHTHLILCKYTTMMEILRKDNNRFEKTENDFILDEEEEVTFENEEMNDEAMVDFTKK